MKTWAALRQDMCTSSTRSRAREWPMARLLCKSLFWFVTAFGLLGVNATGVAWWGSWFLWPFPDPREPGTSLYNGSNYQWCGPQLELVAPRLTFGTYHVYGTSHFQLTVIDGSKYESPRITRASWADYHSRLVYSHPAVEARHAKRIGKTVFLHVGRLMITSRHVTPRQPSEWQYWDLDIYIPTGC